MKLLEWDMFLELAWRNTLRFIMSATKYRKYSATNRMFSSCSEKFLEKIFDAIMKNTFVNDCYNITRKRNSKCLQPASIEIESLTPLEVNNTLNNFESTPEADRNNVSKNRYTERVKMSKLQGEPEANRKLDVKNRNKIDRNLTSLKPAAVG